MKKKILLLIGIFSVGITYGQHVGINTQAPRATLEIVGSGSTNASQAFSVRSASDNEILSLRNHGSLGLGVTTSSVRLDLRDGANNSIVGIGTSNQTAVQAKNGALKYDNGTQALYLVKNNGWEKLSANVIKTYVVADIINTSQSFLNNASATIKNWRVQEDMLGTFVASTGEFKAPRTGTYTISVIATFNSGTVIADSYLQLDLVSPTTSVKCQSTYYNNANFQTSVLCSGNFQLTIGQVLKPVIYHNLGGTKSPKAGYCNLSILEN